MENLKRILIVDDSEIDREILRNMMDEEFEVSEAVNGYYALDLILKKGETFDAILLDVSMPFCDGMRVLRVLRENNLRDIQIFMITAEATMENIEKASQYRVAEFIKKPFDREEVLKRLRAKLGVEKKINLTREDIDETRKYISDLEFIYDRYLSLSGKNRKKDTRRANLMKILLEKACERGTMDIDPFQMEMIYKSVYLCNIGCMLIHNISADGRPFNKLKENENYQQHTVMGAYLLRLNYSKHCRRFVDICAEICQHHHERLDGRGFPHGSRGDGNSIYAQLCGLLEIFDELFFACKEHESEQFDHVIDELNEDRGLVARNVFSMLTDSKGAILNYYNENTI